MPGRRLLRGGVLLNEARFVTAEQCCQMTPVPLVEAEQATPIPYGVSNPYPYPNPNPRPRLAPHPTLHPTLRLRPMAPIPSSLPPQSCPPSPLRSGPLQAGAADARPGGGHQEQQGARQVSGGAGVGGDSGRGHTHTYFSEFGHMERQQRGCRGPAAESWAGQQRATYPSCLQARSRRPLPPAREHRRYCCCAGLAATGAAPSWGCGCSRLCARQIAHA